MIHFENAENSRREEHPLTYRVCIYLYYNERVNFNVSKFTRI